MLDPICLNELKSLLQSEKCNTGFCIDTMLGAMTSFLSSPEYIEEANLEELVVGNIENGFKALFEGGEHHHAWITILNQLDQQLSENRFSLFKLYNIREDMKVPPNAFSKWCKGYLMGYKLNENAWQCEFELLYLAPENECMYEVAENCDATLNLIAIFADWQNSLTDQTQLENLKQNMLYLIGSIDQGVSLFYRVALLFENLKITPDEGDMIAIEELTLSQSTSDSIDEISKTLNGASYKT